MSPTSSPQRMSSETLSVDTHLKIAKENLITVDCPEGTVPIRRIGKEDLIRAKTFSESYVTNVHQPTQITPLAPGEHAAILRSKGTKTVHGISGIISLHNLSNLVKPGQTSSARMWIETRLGNNKVTSLQTGWMVRKSFPQILYVNFPFSTSQYFLILQNKGCFNLLCSNFVQIDRENPVDIVFNETSTYDEVPYVIPINIYQDKVTKNWWLQLNNDVNIGYWPSSSVPDMKNGASYVAWGGLAQGFTYVTSPPLGNSNKPDPDEPDVKQVAYIRLLQISDSSYWLNISEDDVEVYADVFRCYEIGYMKYLGKAIGHEIVYGGPGGECGN
ncbi:hypothetical protein IFM89_003186 [Coptis chinensis]|uniref:Neprosin PEP catalytic domain-containing protein n=1 Tax=Coptis chinensis TaxID=261450 RepID=A0A835LE40_9MAGN|nr:hypothetical protein IFM89_003186 [Coptis chinensis]